MNIEFNKNFMNDTSLKLNFFCIFNILEYLFFRVFIIFLKIRNEQFKERKKDI